MLNYLVLNRPVTSFPDSVHGKVSSMTANFRLLPYRGSTSYLTPLCKHSHLMDFQGHRYGSFTRSTSLMGNPGSGLAKPTRKRPNILAARIWITMMPPSYLLRPRLIVCRTRTSNVLDRYHPYRLLRLTLLYARLEADH